MTATHKMTDGEQRDLRTEFDRLINMSANELKSWLSTEESESVGQTKDGDESIGHQSGERIVEILNRTSSKLTDEDYQQIQRVISYVKRHSAQRPKEVKGSRWAYSLKNWGHDPERK